MRKVFSLMSSHDRDVVTSSEIAGTESKQKSYDQSLSWLTLSGSL